MTTFNDVFDEVRDWRSIPANAVEAYRTHLGEMIAEVDKILSDHPAINTLIGNNPLQVMRDNHKHHAYFMATVFQLSQFDLLARTIPWVYHAYKSHGFSYDYFPVELSAWKKAVSHHLDGLSAKGILTIYDWMLERHQDWIKWSEEGVSLSGTALPEFRQHKEDFLAALLAGDRKKCMDVTLGMTGSPAAIREFYLQVVQPAMYEIGNRWQTGEVSVAQEHLASSLVGRTLTGLYLSVDKRPRGEARAVITAAPNEFHEIGAWMVSDMLELDGWEVRYCGANTPVPDLLNCLREFDPICWPSR